MTVMSSEQWVTNLLGILLSILFEKLCRLYRHVCGWCHSPPSTHLQCSQDIGFPYDTTLRPRTAPSVEPRSHASCYDWQCL